MSTMKIVLQYYAVHLQAVLIYFITAKLSVMLLQESSFFWDFVLFIDKLSV